MKQNMTRVLVGMMVLAVILLMGQEPAKSEPVGEIKLAQSQWGNEIPIPRMELTHANDWLKLLYDPLVGTDNDGKFSPDLGLARKWEMSPDGFTWTFHLKKGIKFHDGVELTSKDVKFSIEQISLSDSKSQYSGHLRKTIKRMETEDPYTVIIHCTTPYLFLPGILSDMDGPDGLIIPKDYFEKVGKDQFAKKPIGTGPYKWHSQVIGSYVKLEATDKHWRDGMPRYKYMTYLIIPEESTRIAMLRTGEIDITRVSREKAKEITDAGLQTIIKDYAAIIVFHCNMQWASPVFSDIRFRKALNLAIDKEAIIKNIFAGLASPVAAYPGKNILTCGGDPTLKPYPYDPGEARRLIKEGGYEGYEFTMVSYPRSGCNEFPRVVEAVVGYWQKIGLKPKILMTDYNAWREKWRARKTENTIHGYDDTSNPESGSLVRRLEVKYQSKVDQTLTNIPKLDEMFDKAIKSLNSTEVEKLLGDIYRYSYDQHLMIPICEIPDIIATGKKIPKWHPGRRRNDRNYNDLIKQR